MGRYIFVAGPCPKGDVVKLEQYFLHFAGQLARRKPTGMENGSWMKLGFHDRTVETIPKKYILGVRIRALLGQIDGFPW